MDRLIAERETEVKEEIKVDLKPEEPRKSYAESFENKTLGDFKREKEAQVKKEFLIEKETLIQNQFQPSEQVSQNIIEKPNYDLIEENTKVVKIKKKNKKQKSLSKKSAGLMLACALGATALICVVNSVVIDNLNSSYSQINETYNVNLQKYLKNIQNLDATKKSMGILETYPDELLDAGDVGKKTNWFDHLCNFLGGMFGG